MTVQRRRGQDCVLYLTILTTDKRGNEVKSADMAHPTPARAAFVSNTGDAVTMNINATPGLDTYSRVEWNGGMYNVGVPAVYSSLSRHTRHWSVELKRTS